MRLGVKEIASALKVPEKKIFDWIKKGSLPFHNVNSHYRLNKIDLLEWFFTQSNTDSTPLFDLPKKLAVNPAKALSRGGVHYHVSASDRNSALLAMKERLILPETIDKEFVFQMIACREDVGYTEHGDGIELPHVRNPIVLDLPEPRIALFFFENRIDFGSKKGQSVDSRFLILSRTVGEHLELLSRLFTLLNHSSFRSLIYCRASEKAILEEIHRIG